MEGLRMVSYFDGQITDILPENIAKKPEVQALSYALQQGCRILYKYSKRLYIYSDLDAQPEEVIDLLAAELRTQYYGNELDIEKKKQLVRNTLTWYMTAGTPAAVEELVTTVFGGGKVTEWFEYGDEPYCFKVETEAVITPETSSFFFDIIRKIKNTRSHLRAVSIKRNLSNEVFTGAGQTQYYRPAAIIDGYSINLAAGAGLYQGTAGLNIDYPEAVSDNFWQQEQAE